MMKDEQKLTRCPLLLKGVLRNCDPNNIFAYCALEFTYCTSNFPTMFVLLNVIIDLVIFKKIFQENKKYPKNDPSTFAPSVFIVSSIMLKLNWYTASTHPSAKYVVTDFFLI